MGPGEQLVQDDAERVHVPAGVHLAGGVRVADGLQVLGRHVREGPAQPALGVADVRGQVEVEHPRLAVQPQQDVGRLQVVVDEPALVDRGQGVGHPHPQPDDPVHEPGSLEERVEPLVVRHRVVGPQVAAGGRGDQAGLLRPPATRLAERVGDLEQVLQGGATQVGHDHQVQPAGDVVRRRQDGHHVLVPEPAEDLGLVALLLGHLDDDVPGGGFLDGQEHPAERPLAQLAEQVEVADLPTGLRPRRGAGPLVDRRPGARGDGRMGAGRGRHRAVGPRVGDRVDLDVDGGLPAAGQDGVQVGLPLADRLLREHPAQGGVVVGESGAEGLGVELLALVLAEEELGERQVEDQGLVGRQVREPGQGGGGVRDGGAVEPGLDDLRGAAVGRRLGWVHNGRDVGAVRWVRHGPGAGVGVPASGGKAKRPTGM